MKNRFFKLLTVRHNHSIQEREVLSLTKVRCSKVSECKKRPIKFVSNLGKVFCYHLHNLKHLLKFF